MNYQITVELWNGDRGLICVEKRENKSLFFQNKKDFKNGKKGYFDYFFTDDKNNVTIVYNTKKGSSK